MREALSELGASVVAISAQDQARAREMIERKQVRYPVGFGFPPIEAAKRLGCFLGGDGEFIQATGFLLRNGRVEEVTYSSGPLGRMEASHVVGHVKYLNKKGQEGR